MHRKELIGLATCTAALLAGTVEAKETKWIGGNSGYICESANWDNGVPSGGDKLVFDRSVVLSNCAAHASFSFSGGLEISVASGKTLTDRVTYSGSGGFKLTGGGTWSSFVPGDFTGDIDVENGVFMPGKNSWARYSVGGNGNNVRIVVRPETGGSLSLNKYQIVLCNDVIFTGGDPAENNVTFSQNSFIRGDLYADCDVRIRSGHGGNDKKNGMAVENVAENQVYGRGRIYASGHTVYVDCVAKAHVFVLPAEVNGSIVKSGIGDLLIAGVSTNVANTLEVTSATNVLSAAAEWHGTNVVVKNEGTVLSLAASGNLSPYAALSVEDGATVDVADGVIVMVAACSVDGTPLAVGEYSVRNMPDVFSGNGILQVIGPVKTWIGAATGLLSDSGNWDDGSAPVSGDRLYFMSDVKLDAESFDFGDGGLTFVISGGRTVTSPVSFSGTGGLVKKGPGKFDFGPEGSFTGDVVLKGGTFLPGKNSWGEYHVGGKGNGVTVVVDMDCDSFLDLGKYLNCFYNDISLIGSDRLGANSIFLNDGAFAAGSVTSSGDFSVGMGGTSKDHTFRGPVSAPGKTVRAVPLARPSWETPMRTNALVFAAEVNASVLRDSGIGVVRLTGNSPNPANAFTVTVGTNVLTETAYWGGTNVTVSGADTVLQLFAKGNLSGNATVHVADGARIDVTGRFNVRVAGMTVDGVPLKNGVYRADNCPSVTGAGGLMVGRFGMTVVVR